MSQLWIEARSFQFSVDVPWIGKIINPILNPLVNTVRHDYWVLRTPEGQVIAELHGMATIREGNPGAGTFVPIGTDETHSLRVWQFVHNDSYKSKLQNSNMGSYSLNVGGQPGQVVYEGEEADVLHRWNAAAGAISALNALDLDYPPYGHQMPNGGDIVNSNSTYRTLGERMGIPVYDFPNAFELGLDNRMGPRVEYQPPASSGNEKFLAPVGGAPSGEDTLRGGKGADEYRLDIKGETIDDDDGSLYIDDVQMTGGSSKGGSTYRNESTRSTYTKLGGRVRVETDDGGLVYIKDWQQGDVGITLIDERDPPPPPPPVPPVRYDPLVIDMDGDGLELRNADGQVLFDHNADGIRTGTGWASPDDALLVWDRNGNGVIDTGRELFGIDTLKLTGQNATNGFDALLDQDTNADGEVDQDDQNFSQLRVWNDLNQNGISEAGELRTLAAAGIASIGLQAQPDGRILANNRVDSIARVTLANGGSTVVAAIDLAQNPLAREFTPDTVEGHIDISGAVASLPNLQGSGMVRDLREAMSLGNAQSAALTGVVQQYMQATSRDAQFALLDSLLATWASTSTHLTSIQTSTLLATTGAAPGSETAIQKWARLNPDAAQHAAIVERFRGANYVDRWLGLDSTGWFVTLTPQMQAEQDRGWVTFKDNLYTSLLLQTRLKPYIDAIVQDPTADRFDTSGLTTLIQSRYASSPRDAIIDLFELNTYAAATLQWAQFDVLEALQPMLDALPADSPLRGELTRYGYVNNGGTWAADMSFGSTQADSINAGEGNDFVSGGGGNDTLLGGWGRDFMSGGSGDDRLDGEGDKDTLLGGTGNDSLSGGDGIDLLDGGTGNDTLDGGTGADWMRGGAGDDVYVVDDFADRIDERGGGGVDTVRTSFNWVLADDVENLVLTGGYPVYGVGNAGNNRIQGNWNSNILVGGDGDDTLISGGGRDTIEGDGGNDQITLAPEGAMVYFARGNGADTVRADYELGTVRSSDNYLAFSPGVWIPDLALDNLGQGNFRLRIIGTDDSISFRLDENDIRGSSRPFDEVQFRGLGRQVSWDSLIDALTGMVDLEHLPYSLIGNDQDNLIVGSRGTDTSLTFDYGGHESTSGGDDTVYGDAGDDNLSEWDGNDVLFGGRGDDRLLAAAGINILLGEEGNDILSGRNNGDSSTTFFDGGAGDDKLEGSTSRDVYYFGRGSGNDQVSDDDRAGQDLSHDVVILGAGIAPSDVSVSLVQNGPMLRFAGSDDSLVVWGVEALQFDDGTVWTMADVYSRIVQVPTSGNDTIDSLNMNSTLSGGAGNDIITSRDGNDLLMGDEGDDALSGNGGNDTLIGGTGADWHVSGGVGSDVYIYNRGDGYDTIFDGIGDRSGPSADVDEIRMNMNASEVSLSRGGANLRITVTANPADEMMVYGWFDAQYNQNTLVVRFADGTVWNADYLRAHAVPADAASLYGGPGNDAITGTAAPEFIVGSNGDDTIDGGAGGDRLRGGLGNDTFVFGYGYGSVVIDEGDSSYVGGGIDTIRLNASVRPQDVLITNTSEEKTISLANSGDKIRFNSYYEYDRIERLVFSNGTVWNLFENPSGPLVGGSGDDSLSGTSNDDVIQGGSGNDSLYGGDGHDILVGGAGNDWLQAYQGGRDTVDGGAGNDLVSSNGLTVSRFGIGDGQDTIGGYGHYDLHVEFKEGVRPQDIHLTSRGNNTLRIEILGTSDRIDSPFWFTSGLEKTDNTLVFSDGTRWNTAEILARIDSSPTPGNDGFYGTVATQSLYGGDGDDTFVNFAHGMLLSGDGGNDSLTSSGGNDTLRGGTGNDTLLGGGGIDTYLFNRGDGQDFIEADQYNTAGASRGRIVFGPGVLPDDIVVGGSTAENNPESGMLTLSIRGTDDKISMKRWLYQSAYAKVDEVVFSNGTVWTASDLLTRFFAANPGGEMFGAEYADQLTGAAGNDEIEGFGGNDLLSGMGGDDSLFGDFGNDTLDGGAGRDWLVGGVGDDTYLFRRGHGRDEIADYDRVSGSADQVLMGPGIAAGDIDVSRNETDIILTIRGTSDELRIRWYQNAGFAIEAIVFEGGTVWTASQLQQMADASAVVQGTAGNDSLTGGMGDDRLRGLAGNDTLVGLLGRDTLEGGAGDDVYVVESASDVVVELAGQGRDQVRAVVEVVLADNVEDLYLVSTDAIGGRGNALANLLVGNEAGNRLDGAAGADVMVGAGGDDVYVVDNAGDTATELAGGGIDTVEASLSWTLGSALENLTLTGTAAIQGTGNALDNTLRGNQADNTLEGGAGNDTLLGGGGTDTYVFRRGGGQDTLNDAQGDRILFAADIAPSDIEVTRSGSDVVLTIAGSQDRITVIDLHEGRNELSAVFANGTVWSSSTLLDMSSTLTGTAGNDTVRGIEHGERILGLEGNDTLYGESGSDTLDGGTGSDSMLGGGDNDIYYVDSATDKVSESSNDWGWDTIRSTVTFALPSNIEVIELLGSADINATGNGSANELYGNAGNNVLNGGSGNDYMEGRLGDDTYVVGTEYDYVVEHENEGIDTVQSSISYALGENLENLALTSSTALEGIGNEYDNNITGSSAANTLIGDAGNDTLTGGSGADTLIGGTGNDTYGVDSTLDVVTELSDEGIDTVLSSVSHELGQHLENLTLTGSSTVNGTGNALANILVGNTKANRLDGGAGADTMSGGVGSDVYVVDNAGDVVTELAGEGTDTIETSLSLTLVSEVEKLTLTGAAHLSGTGNALDNTLTGNSGNNRLDGGAGADTMIGGGGNDTYVVDASGDTTTEVAGGGTDTVESTVTLTLAAEVENLVLQGSAAINGTGNALDNLLTGNSGINKLTGGTGKDTLEGGAGDDSLDGGVGDDRLVGGTGNDTYYVDSISDVLVELAGEGIDLVRSGVNITLGNNLENLILTGTATNGTGNALDNVLTGTSVGDTLDGGAGNDSLDGGSGTDSLIGGLGNDTLDGGTSTDTMVGGQGDDVYIVASSADVVTESANEGIDTVLSSTTLTLAANVENLTLTGTATNATGNALNNVLTGNSSANKLTGGAGSDTYVYNREGGADTIDTKDVVGATDTLRFGAGITAADLTVTKSGQDLVLTLNGGPDKVTLLGHYNAATTSGGVTTDSKIDSVVFDNGSKWTTKQLEDAIAGPNRTPSLDNLLADQGASQGNAFSYVVPANAFSDPDAGTTLVYTATLLGGAALPAWLIFDPLARSFSGTPPATGTFTVTVKASDGSLSASDNFDLTVTGNSLNGTAGNDSLSGGANADLVQGLAGNDTLNGLAGNDTLDGGVGVDSLVGGLGDDTYLVDDTGDIVNEASGQGSDTVQSSATMYTLGSNIEKIVLLGTGDISATGNTLNNDMTGNSGANTLRGAAGDDTMRGGLGNDTYIVGAGDLAIENAGEGFDTISTGVDWTLEANFEGLVFTDSSAHKGTGNALDNSLTGYTGADTLDGLAGNDSLIGGSGADLLTGGTGNDSLTGGAGNDVYVFNRGDGQDVIDNTDAAALLDTLRFGPGIAPTDVTVTQIGLDLVISLKGSPDRVTLQRYAERKIDLVEFGVGGPTWTSSQLEAAITTANQSPVRDHELLDQGVTQGSAFSYVVPANTFSDPDAGTTLSYRAELVDGAALPGWLVFNAGDRSFSGTPPTAGTYSVRVIASDGPASADDVFDLVVAPSGISGTAGNDSLSGTADADTLVGLAGNDTLNGLAGDDLLDGGAGDDSLVGGIGNDTYVIDSAGDVVKESSGQGDDSVRSGIAYTLGSYVEHLTLTGSADIGATGNSLNNRLVGNSGANKLDGGTGDDTMTGGTGNDTYVVNSLGDVVVENAGEGIDLIQSSLDFTLANYLNVENLDLTSTAINGTGNALDNKLIGNNSNNTLTGGAGNDTLDGGWGDDVLKGDTGNDSYYVTSLDVVTELAGEGIDTIYAEASFVLSANVENLTQINNSGANATGNELANRITGASGGNVLKGMAGNDTLEGGAGNDTVEGGVGNDTYLFGRGFADDSLREDDATAGNTDVLQFLDGVAFDQVWMRRVSDSLEVSVIGTTDMATIRYWYRGNQYHIEQFKTSDGKTLLDTQVQNLVDEMARFTPPAAGQNTLPPNYQTVADVIAANWAG